MYKTSNTILFLTFLTNVDIICCNWCIIKVLSMMDPSKNDITSIIKDFLSNHKKCQIPNISLYTIWHYHNLFLFIYCR